MVHSEGMQEPLLDRASLSHGRIPGFHLLNARGVFFLLKSLPPNKTSTDLQSGPFRASVIENCCYQLTYAKSCWCTTAVCCQPWGPGILAVRLLTKLVFFQLEYWVQFQILLARKPSRFSSPVFSSETVWGRGVISLVTIILSVKRGKKVENQCSHPLIH